MVSDTLNTQRYREEILQPFFEHLHDDKLRFFQQEGATAHTTQDTKSNRRDLRRADYSSEHTDTLSSQILFVVVFKKLHFSAAYR
jgi:hypothetical protein